MKPVNLPAGSQRNSEVGLLWKEVYNGAAGYTAELPFQYTFRVSAAADVTVTIDGVLAMTLRSGEVERFNTGAGYTDTRSTVTVVIGAGDARVQVAEEKDPGRRTR
jgi:hypothetical protein